MQTCTQYSVYYRCSKNIGWINENKWVVSVLSLRGKGHSLIECLLYFAYVTTQHMLPPITGQDSVSWGSMWSKWFAFLLHWKDSSFCSGKGSMEEGSSEQPYGKVGSYTLEPSPQGSLEYSRVSREGLLASQPPSSWAWQGDAQGLCIMETRPFPGVLCKWRRGLCGRETPWPCLYFCVSRYLYF